MTWGLVWVLLATSRGGRIEGRGGCWPRPAGSGWMSACAELARLHPLCGCREVLEMKAEWCFVGLRLKKSLSPA